MDKCFNSVLRFLETTSIVKLLLLMFLIGGVGTIIYEMTNDIMNYILYLFK